MSASARIVLLVGLLIEACGATVGSASAPSPSASASPVASTHSLFPAPSTSAAAIVVTRADDHQTVVAHVGDELQIALGDQYQWMLDPPDGVVLVQPFQTFLLRQGVQALWLAKSAGRSTIKASGTVPCATGPCPAPLVFTATVNVLP